MESGYAQPWFYGMSQAFSIARNHPYTILIYSLLRYGTAYVDAGQHAYEQQYRDRVLSNLQRKAHALGYKLMRVEEAAAMP